MRQKIRLPRLSIRAASARPQATERPWPSEPVAASKRGNPSAGLGWPSTGESIARSVVASSKVMGFRSPSAFRYAMPRSAIAAYSTGTAWPSESTSRSLAGWPGFMGSKRTCW